ncbi:FG-GAP-like repeat-containing protein [Streptomyces sp. NPDC018019]|uniref:FG-GAP-like repeat-containing protein n=1 Tax=Streptomyces sp. NPDC018019 TaxID=3365030 RepID=UPI0037A37EE7
MKRSLVPRPGRSRPLRRQLVAGAVVLGLAVSAGPLVSPAAVAAPAAAPKVAPGSEIVSAGPTGFLSVDPKNTLRWTRYADGTTTEVGQDSDQHTQTIARGSVSDVVVVGDSTTVTASHKITLRDMATGTSTPIDLDAHGYRYEGAVGSWVIAVKYLKDNEEAHVLGLVDGKLTDRKITGLPEKTRKFEAVAGTPGSALVRFDGMPDHSPFRSNDYAVIDLAAAKVSDYRGLMTDDWAGAALSPTHMASIGALYDGDRRVSLSVSKRGPERQPWNTELSGVYTSMVGLVGDWALYGNERKASEGWDQRDTAFRAVPIGGHTARDVLDHATSVAPTPEGDLLVMGGSVDRGEGVYRVSAGADGAPVTKLVASTGEPTKITLVGSDVPAVAELERGHWRARWQLSRLNADVTVTLRHTASGKERTFELRPDNREMKPGWVDVDWDGLLGSGTDTVAAPNGAYTWKLNAKPTNGLGPDVNADGTFTVRRRPAPHDYTDNGSPDVIVRDEVGGLSLNDTYHGPQDKPQLQGTTEKWVGPGWNIYDRIVAVGDVAGAAVGDVVARDRSGVLWLYLGTGDGKFATRAKIGAGWNMYDQLTGGSDLNGDGRGDLLARDTDGVLWLYEGTGDWRAPFAPRKRIGGGWDMYDQIAAVGDVAGASAGDLVARDPSGVLWLYLGTGDGKFATRAKIGAGWGAYRQLVGIGDADTDGRADLFVTTPDGSSYLYHGTGDWRAPFAPRQLTGIEAPSYKTIA